MSTFRNSKTKTFSILTSDGDCPGLNAAIRGVYRAAHETGMETRATVLGYVQRGGIPSASDHILATRLGTRAADIHAKGEYGHMVALDGDKITTVNLNISESKVKSAPENHYMIDTAVAVGTCMGID